MELITKKTILTTRPFTVEEVFFKTEHVTPTHGYMRLAAPDWVNVLPVTLDQQVILIRQPRVGSMSYVLETPGGVMDAHEKDPTMAAVRELEEETGYVSQRILPLATINPNPAIMTNRCHFFVALGCQIASPRRHFPDADEHIELELKPIGDLELLVRTGRINHALAALCIMLAQKYIGSNVRGT